jgi:hypothetical protein
MDLDLRPFWFNNQRRWSMSDLKKENDCRNSKPIGHPLWLPSGGGVEQQKKLNQRITGK